MKEKFWALKRIQVIIALALFNFVFLGTEYLFDNMMAYVTNSDKVVIAQNYVLGASVLGLLLFVGWNRFLKRREKLMSCFLIIAINIVCISMVLKHESYLTTLLAGIILFIFYGISGSAVHYMAACVLTDDRHLAKTVGIAYALGLLLQFINNNVVNRNSLEAFVLSVFFVIFMLFCARLYCDIRKNMTLNNSEVQCIQRPDCQARILDNPAVSCLALSSCVVLMTCIFSTLDNVVTLYHASGSMDIGQTPRLLLAVSGLVSGFLYDMGERHYMNIIMYCVTLLSTICVLVIIAGGPFMIGLIVFYLSAGFFVVFFTASFMELSHSMKVPELWAGIGRSLNNLCALLIAPVSVALLQSGNSLKISITALVLFVLISIANFIYVGQFQGGKEKKDIQEETDTQETEYDEINFSGFCKSFSLTKREGEVLRVLLISDENVQDIAKQLFISRAALYRHIASMNEKTQTKSRIGLIQFYFGWNERNSRNL